MGRNTMRNSVNNAMRQRNLSEYLKDKAMNTPQFKNGNLQNDLGKILSYNDWLYTDITTDYNKDLGFILDVKDNGYFYENESDRDFDDSLIMEVLKDSFGL